ncbi:MAG: hypothetical protein VB144_06420 [Clostridia bacterium]|nr:hypothetical protein [Clostridia bacterium]
MENIDQRNRLAEEPFSYRVSKDRKVFIYWHGEQVVILSGKASERFLVRISEADARTAQLIMAKATGNFKHGNEKLSE